MLIKKMFFINKMVEVIIGQLDIMIPKVYNPNLIINIYNKTNK
jgi:hypothetical protein